MKSSWYTTIDGLVVFIRVVTFFILLIIVLNCFIGSACTVKDVGIQIAAYCVIPAGVSIVINPIKRRLVTRFPINCGHRKCIFTGRSSRSLRELLLNIDQDVPSEEELRKLKSQVSLFLGDFVDELEKTLPTATFECIFSGSVLERFGIPLCHKRCQMFSALNTEFDVMFCAEADNASFSGQKGNVVVELVSDADGYNGYAQLRPLCPRFDGDLVSSRDVKRDAYSAISKTKITHFPEVPKAWYNRCNVRPNTKFCSEGPAFYISIGSTYEVGITICVKCCEWPPISDWPTRQRCWPSQDDVTRIVAHGCHLVAKPAPSDKEQTSWRFSFSVAEVELSKLVPKTARKCLLALKIILKDHLQPVVGEISSYHVKTVFLSTLEKTPVEFWVDENIGECFVFLLKEFHDTLVSEKCPHYWFKTINLFDGIKQQKLKLVVWKMEKILEYPVPFIFDDGPCCISPCFSQIDENQRTIDVEAEFGQVDLDIDDKDDQTI